MNETLTPEFESVLREKAVDIALMAEKEIDRFLKEIHKDNFFLHELMVNLTFCMGIAYTYNILARGAKGSIKSADTKNYLHSRIKMMLPAIEKQIKDFIDALVDDANIDDKQGE